MWYFICKWEPKIAYPHSFFHSGKTRKILVVIPYPGQGVCMEITASTRKWTRWHFPSRVYLWICEAPLCLDSKGPYDSILLEITHTHVSFVIVPRAWKWHHSLHGGHTCLQIYMCFSVFSASYLYTIQYIQYVLYICIVCSVVYYTYISMYHVYQNNTPWIL